MSSDESADSDPSPEVVDVVSVHTAHFTSPDECLDSNPAVCVVEAGSGRGVTQLKAPQRNPEGQSVFCVRPPFAALPPTLFFLSTFSEVVPVAGVSWLPISTPPSFRCERVVKHKALFGAAEGSGVVAAPKGSKEWCLLWSVRGKDEDFETLRQRPHARVNHFPRTYLIGRKDHLARLMQKANARHPGAFSFLPRTYLLPPDRTQLDRDLSVPGATFIWKPPASARGRGIEVFDQSIGVPSAGTVSPSEAELIEYDVVQRYVPNPLLMNGFKFDLRVYCACTSFDPLRIYVYNEGLVRFATEKYGESGLDNKFSHLTNFSVNQRSTGFVKPGHAEDETASKWTLHALRRFFLTQGWPWDATWSKVCDVLVKTLIACESDVVSVVNRTVRHRDSCFELFGFDFLLDDTFDAHLLEVNVMPSLACSSPLDKHVKGHLVADLITLIGLSPTPTDATNSPITARKGTPEGWATDAKRSATFLADLEAEDRHVIRLAEAELHRCRGFTRLMPAHDSDARFGPLFLTARFHNHVLWRWEREKRRWGSDFGAARAWLDDRGPFPLPPSAATDPGRGVAPVKAVKAPPAPTATAKPRRSVTAPKLTALPTKREPPKTAEKQAVSLTTFSFAV